MIAAAATASLHDPKWLSWRPWWVEPVLPWHPCFIPGPWPKVMLELSRPWRPAILLWRWCWGWLLGERHWRRTNCWAPSSQCWGHFFARKWGRWSDVVSPWWGNYCTHRAIRWNSIGEMRIRDLMISTGRPSNSFCRVICCIWRHHGFEQMTVC